MAIHLIRRSASAAVFAMMSCAMASAIDVGIGRLQINRALDISRRSEAERQSFHSSYIIRIGNPTVDSFEIVTEFRRVMLASEDRLRLGDHLFDTLDAEKIGQPWRGRVSIIAHLRFNPQTALVTIPSYEMSLVGSRDTSDLVPLDIRRTPLYAGTALVGADVEAIFDAAPLARAKRTIVLQLPPKQVAAAGFDFASIE